MRSNRHKSIVVLLVVSIWALLCIDVSAGKSKGANAQEAYKDLLKSLTAQNDSTITPFLIQWADYLKSASTYSIDDHTEAFNVLQQEYLQLMSQMEQCFDNSKKLYKNYDPAWMEQFIAHFGVPYLKDKEESVLLNLRMIIAGSSENCCGQIMEKLFYSETVLYSAYRYYLNLFLDFYNKQPPAAQNALKTRKEAAENFLKLIDFASITKVLLGGGEPQHKLSEIRASNYDKAIHDYFINNPPACDIDAFKAIEDFRKSIRGK
ncbi:MAG: hypothetical protein WAU91_14035 [Desulfatitalea sp.]